MPPIPPVQLSQFISINKGVLHNQEGIFHVNENGGAFKVTIPNGTDLVLMLQTHYEKFEQWRTLANTKLPGDLGERKKVQSWDDLKFLSGTGDFPRAVTYDVRDKLESKAAHVTPHLLFTSEYYRVEVLQAQVGGVNVGYIDDLPFQTSQGDAVDNPLVPDALEDGIDLPSGEQFNTALWVLGAAAVATFVIGGYFFLKSQGAFSGGAQAPAAQPSAPAPAPIIVNVPK